MNTLIGPIIVIIIIVMIVMMVVKMIKSLSGGKKVKKVDLPRNPVDRLITYYKEVLNLNRSGNYRLKMSGDKYKKGYYVGWAVFGVIPDNREHIFFVRKKRWLTRQKPVPLVVEPHLCGDLNTRELLIKGRGVYKVNQFNFIIPTYDTPKQDQDDLYSKRSEFVQYQSLMILESDLNTDLVEATKTAIRNSIVAASREESEIGEMEKVSEEERRRISKEKEQELEAEKKRRATMDSYRQQPSSYGGNQNKSFMGGLFGGGGR
jgi:hypothetical protein